MNRTPARRAPARTTGRTAPRHAVLDSPLGPLVAVEDGGALVRLGPDRSPDPAVVGPRDDAVLPALREQLAAYWDGALSSFDVRLGPGGTPFQQRVWAALRTIPYGQTWSYARLADEIGQPSAVRAVGAANGRNPVFLVVPCHRVVGSDGTLVGYAGGLDAKRFLLDHERASMWTAAG
jgi:methylated-DNA-[protein]-cysteine S-methyltransferase